MSTKTQVRRSPIAWCSKTATTAESTPPGKPANYRAVANFLPRLGDRGVAEGGHRPAAGAARDAAGEIPQQRRTLRGVHDLGMELDAVEATHGVGDDREGRTLGHRDDVETVGDRDHAVAVTHPHLGPPARRPEVGEEIAASDDIEPGAAELAALTRLHAPAQRRAHRLLAIADAEHGHAELENPGIGARRRGASHRGRPAREDERRRRRAVGRGPHLVEGDDLAVDAAFTDAAGDKLGKLRSEIDDHNPLGHGGDATCAAGPEVFGLARTQPAIP